MKVLRVRPKHYPEVIDQPRKFVTYMDSEGKAHLDVDYCTPEE